MKMRQAPKDLHRLTTWLDRKPYRAAKSVTLASICLLMAFLACGPVTGAPDQPPGGQPPTATTEAPPDDLPPSITPSPTATESPWFEGSVERAPYDPAAGLGAPDIHDDFSGTNPEFELDNSSGVAHGWYQNGRFNITFPTRGWWTWYSGSAELTNFYIDVVVYNGDQCVDRDAAGLLFRQIQAVDLGWLFGVTCGGGYFTGVSGGPGPAGVVCFYDGSAVDCSGMWSHPTSEYIDTGPGAANRIGVKAVGQEITFYINGHLVDSMLFAPAWVYSGNFALYLGPGQRDKASVSFDDLSIWFNP
jgi:hypothetical protein